MEKPSIQFFKFLFFIFACGRYQTDHKVGSRQAIDRFVEVGQIVEQKKASIVFDNTTKYTVPSILKMQQYRDKCLDVKSLEDTTTNPRAQELLDEFDTLDGMPILTTVWPPAGKPYIATTLLNGLASLMTDEEILIKGEITLFSDGVTYLVFRPAKLFMKNLKDYSDPNSGSKRQALKDFLVEIVSFLAADSGPGHGGSVSLATIAQAIDLVFNFEVQLAALLDDAGPLPEDTIEKEKKVEKKKISDLNGIFGYISWTQYLANDMYPDELVDYLDQTRDIYIYNEALFRKINTLIGTQTEATMANYFFLRVLVQSVPYLDSRFAGAADKLAQKIDGSTSATTRDQLCMSTITKQFTPVVDHMYVENFFKYDDKQIINQLIENVRVGMREMLNAETWLEESTKKYALQKLDRMRKFVGITVNNEDTRNLDRLYERLNLDSTADSYRQMAIKVSALYRWTEAIKLIVPSYQEDFGLGATDVNAYYVPIFNAIFIATGITGMVDLKMPKASIYGALGFVIGHEFSHGFDNTGANYDEDGKVKDWWDPTTKQEFNDRSQCMVKQYGDVEIKAIGKNIDGQLTLGENIADNAGIKAAFKAYKNYLKSNNDPHIPGYPWFNNEQAFFLSTATAWCGSYSPEYVEHLYQTDNHSPNFARINVVLSNFNEFAKAFKCKKGTKMNPTNQCEIW